MLDYGGENIDLYMYLIKNFPKIKISVLNQKKLSDELKKNSFKRKKIDKIKYFRILIKLKQKNLILFFLEVQFNI